ncbi:hypothetical protein IWX90DRAFT_493393 [Phyllosticta citrichinensis]|uniref:Uncharacterized protein n=1 Tax=Phyllosticta citrichinensis TaxID=1130410 RepID=A0ABR1Y805_9PEZI
MSSPPGTLSRDIQPTPPHPPLPLGSDQVLVSRSRVLDEEDHTTEFQYDNVTRYTPPPPHVEATQDFNPVARTVRSWTTSSQITQRRPRASLLLLHLKARHFQVKMSSAKECQFSSEAELSEDDSDDQDDEPRNRRLFFSLPAAMFLGDEDDDDTENFNVDGLVAPPTPPPFRPPTPPSEHPGQGVLPAAEQQAMFRRRNERLKQLREQAKEQRRQAETVAQKTENTVKKEPGTGTILRGQGFQKGAIKLYPEDAQRLCYLATEQPAELLDARTRCTIIQMNRLDKPQTGGALTADAVFDRTWEEDAWWPRLRSGSIRSLRPVQLGSSRVLPQQLNLRSCY